MKALIDADELVYKIALKYEVRHWVVLKGDKEQWRYKYKADAIESIGNRDDLELVQKTEVLPLTDIKSVLTDYVSSIIGKTGATSLRFYLSGKCNFRYGIGSLLPYKGTRSKEKPFHFENVRGLFLSRGAEFLDYLEADDMLSANYNLISGENIICSSDKDLKTVPSLNFDINKGIIRPISEDVARYNFWYQILMGDSVDNIPSPYLLGPVKATDMLKGCLGKSDAYYYQHILPEYTRLLKDKDRRGEYKTKWYRDNLSIEEIIYEIGNLLWMHRTLDENERWQIPA